MNIVIKCLALFFGISTLAYSDTNQWHFKPADVTNLHSNPANVRLYYGKDKQQFGDLRLPTGSGPFPVIIIIHGGCWLSSYAQLTYTAALSDVLRDMGYATWNLEYRQIDLQGGGWPGSFADIANGTDYLRKIATQYHLDLNKVIVLGHSAGGHFALWLAGRHHLPTSSPVYVDNPLPLRGVLALAAPPDLILFRTYANKICNADVIGKLQPFNQTSPNELLPMGIPQILIYGSEDKAVPINFAESYIRKAEQAGDKVKVQTIQSAGHHEFAVPNSIAWPTIQAAVKELLPLEK